MWSIDRPSLRALRLRGATRLVGSKPVVGAAGQRVWPTVVPIDPREHLRVAEGKSCNIVTSDPPRPTAVMVGMALRRHEDRRVGSEGEAHLRSRWGPGEPFVVETEE